MTQAKYLHLILFKDTSLNNEIIHSESAFINERKGS